MNFWQRLGERLFGAEIQRRVSLAVKALDDVRDLMVSSSRNRERDRFTFDREEIQRDALLAWRDNPLARRIVSLTSQYVVGGGLSVSSKHGPTHDFLQEWWVHRLNRLRVRAFEWCDELTRTGNLIVLLSTDASGMSYVRALPASAVLEIVTLPNDVEQAVEVVEKPLAGQSEGTHWKVYDQAADRQADDGAFRTVALHYAINRPVGATWGESDLAPLLKWFSRYSAWLEDRARLNRFRQSFMYIVRGVFQSSAERLRRQAELNANPPSPGSILVTDAQSEAWGVLNPQLDSFEAGEDGLAIKKYIAAGSGNPMHFLAEPEGETRTTAEAAGGPTFRHYEQRQLYFLWLIADVATVARNRRASVPGSRVTVRADVTATGTDISARDNQSLAAAASEVITSFATLRDRGLIDDREYLRLVYKFTGEVADLDELLEHGQAAPRAKAAPPPITPPDPGGAGGGSNGHKPPTDAEEGIPLGSSPITERPTPDRALLERLLEQQSAIRNQKSEIHVNFPEHFAQVHTDVHPPNVHVDVPTQPVPDVVVHTPEVTVVVPESLPSDVVVNTPEVTVLVPEQVPPNVVVQVPQADSPDVIVNVPPPTVVIHESAPPQVDVNVTNEIKIPTVTETFVVERDEEGRAQTIKKTVEQEQEDGED